MIPIIKPVFSRNYFIQQNITALEKQILTSSEELINHQLKEIYKLTQAEFFEIALLNKFLKRIQKKKRYYYNKQYARYDWSLLPLIIMACSLLAISITAYYYTCTHYNWSDKSKLIMISLLTSVYTYYMLKNIYTVLQEWSHPNYAEYKEYYAKLSYIEKKIEQKISNLRKKYNLKNKSA